MKSAHDSKFYFSIVASATALILSACAQDSGFKSNVSSYCAAPNCTGLIAANPDIFISNQSLSVKKKLTSTPGSATFGVLPQEVSISGTCTFGLLPYHDITISYWPQANVNAITVLPTTVKCESGRFILSFNPNVQNTAVNTKTQTVYGVKASLRTGQNISTAVEAAAFQSVITIEQ